MGSFHSEDEGGGFLPVTLALAEYKLSESSNESGNGLAAATPDRHQTRVLFSGSTSNIWKESEGQVSMPAVQIHCQDDVLQGGGYQGSSSGKARMVRRNLCNATYPNPTSDTKSTRPPLLVFGDRILPNIGGYIRNPAPAVTAAVSEDDWEIAHVWQCYHEAVGASEANIPGLDGTRHPNNIHAVLSTYLGSRPHVVLRESIKAKRIFKHAESYQITSQDRIDFAPLLDVQLRNYPLIRRAAIVRKFLTRKRAGMLPIKFDIQGIDASQYGGNLNLDMLLVDKSILASEDLENLYGLGYSDIKSLRNARHTFCDVLEEYCMVQMILAPADYEALISPLLQNLRQATWEFANSKGHSSSAGNKRKVAIEILKQGLGKVF